MMLSAKLFSSNHTLTPFNGEGNYIFVLFAGGLFPIFLKFILALFDRCGVSHFRAGLDKEGSNYGNTG